MEEIINSIMQSPENTNPNVLRGQLEGLATGGSEITVVHNVDGTLDITAGELAELCQNGVCFIETDLKYQLILEEQDSEHMFSFNTADQTFLANGYDNYPRKVNR